MDAFVETNRRLDLGLQLGVGVDVVPIERLLHHQQMEFVKSCKMPGILGAVCGVGIDREEYSRELVANGPYELIILSRLDLQFDPLISPAELLGDLGHESFGVLANAQ